ncbi:hypothetical protein L1987_52372 [Smallanthus sonchifolius]|uniref:Uncharacterized protein n=1 Tax=Smallanthus sonchifolius TaxID=185202 RepID=A0ACB9ESD8_9ASTR|nr:hypothetical protein L1987_52372 [Smallanthus sonchifolius]
MVAVKANNQRKGGYAAMQRHATGGYWPEGGDGLRQRHATGNFEGWVMGRLRIFLSLSRMIWGPPGCNRIDIDVTIFIGGYIITHLEEFAMVLVGIDLLSDTYSWISMMLTGHSLCRAVSFWVVGDVLAFHNSSPCPLGTFNARVFRVVYVLGLEYFLDHNTNLSLYTRIHVYIYKKNL